MYKVYKLVDEYDEVIYIGITKNVKQRWANGWRWINVDKNKIKMVIIEETDDKKRERYWIEFYSNECNLLNSNKGCGFNKKEYYDENKDKFKEYYEDNKDRHKEYYEENKERIKEYAMINKDSIKKRKKNYYENNKDKSKKYYDEWIENNRKRWNEYQKEYKRKKKLEEMAKKPFSEDNI